MKNKKFSFWERKNREENKDNEKNADSRFAKVSETLSKYFSTEPEKEKVLRYEDFDAAGDTYYATVSAWYKVLQRIFLVCLAVFAVVAVTVNFKHITYDNFFYLIKDFNTAVDTENVRYETLSYDASADQSFALYRGGLAVVSRSNVSAFTATGRRTLNSNSAYSKPFALSSDKYLLIYDIGEGNMDIYNSFAKVYSEKLNYPISGACFSKEGSFAVITRSEEYESEIIVYDKNFKKLINYRKGSFALDVAISPDGRTLGAVYVDTDNGLVCTKLVFYDLKKNEKIDELLYSGEFPLACSFLDGGGFAVITDSTVRVFDKLLDESTQSDNYFAGAVSALWCDNQYAAVAVNDGITSDTNEVFVFDKNGYLVYNDIIHSDVSQLAVCDGYFFVKNASGVVRIDVDDGFEQRLESQDGKLLIYDGSTALVCAEAKAVYLNFDN